MTKLIRELSVFLPCYNEAKNLVKDGSKDNTLAIAEKLASKNKHLRVINHSENRGYGAALKSGLYGAKYPWIAFIDADGQFDFSEIDSFIDTQARTNADLVIGY